MGGRFEHRLERFAQRPANRVRFSPAGLAQAGRCSRRACVTHGLLAVRLQKAIVAFNRRARSPSAFRTEALFRRQKTWLRWPSLRPNSKHQENAPIKVAALRGQQCPRVACPCASFRRRCNPALKRGTLRLGLNRLLPGLPWEALKEGNISPLALGAPQCPRKMPPSQATR